MTYKITVEDFRRIVNVAACRQGCRGQEVQGGNAKEGHGECGACPGNYYAGGECNYGGRHKLSEELDRINQNFEGFGVLVSRYAKLKKVKDENAFAREKAELVRAFETMQNRCNNPSGFLYATCVGVDQERGAFQSEVQRSFGQFAGEVGKFINSVKKCTYQQFIEFQLKLKKIENLKAEAAKLARDIKNEKDPVKRAKLIAQLDQMKNDISGLAQELENHPARDLFDDDLNTGLDNLLRDIIRGGEGAKKNPFLNPRSRGKG
jgi:hypothetical protein